MTQNVLLPIANGSEDMEVAIIADILRRAEINVTLASVAQSTQITCANGLKINADALIEDVAEHEYEMIVLPGGIPGAEHLRDSEILTGLLNKQKKQEGWIAAICASPAVILQYHGLIDGAYATCYPAFQQQLDNELLLPDDAVVVDEHHRVITSQGPGTAMRFALTLVEELQGVDAADAIEQPLCMIEEVDEVYEEVEEVEDEHQCCGGSEKKEHSCCGGGSCGGH